MPLIKFIFLSSFAILCFSGQAKAVETVTEYYAPLQVKNDDGTLGGFATEIVNRLFDITNEDQKLNILPWARAYRIALQQPNTLIYSIAKTPARLELFDWVGKIKSERYFVWGLRARFNKPLESLEQAKTLRVAVPKSYQSATYLSENGFEQIYHTSQNRQAVGMLFKKRVDIIVSSEIVLRSLAQKYGYDFSKMIKLVNVSELNHDLNIAFSRGSDDALVKRFRLAYDYLEKSGELDELRDKWQVYDDRPLLVKRKTSLNSVLSE